MSCQPTAFRKCRLFLVLTLFVVLPPGPLAADEYEVSDLNEQLVMATAWYQTSAEMRAICWQAFNLARLLYDRDLEKTTIFQKRAVILDIGETILDNSPYEAGLIGEDHDYSVGWTGWLRSRKAKALPGAVDFCTYVARKGGAVFYITNLKERYQEDILAILKKEGFPLADERHVLMRSNNRDKQPRRNRVAKDHRVVLLMGDNLNDFQSIYTHRTISERAALVDKHRDLFGTRFILLPNPMYGDWEGAAYQHNWRRGPVEKDRLRKAPLKVWRPGS